MHLRSSCYHPAGYIPVNFQKIHTQMASWNLQTEETTSSQARPELQKKHLEPVSLCQFRVFFGPVSVDRLTWCHSLWIQLCLLRKRQLGWTLNPTFAGPFSPRVAVQCEKPNQRSQRKVSIRSLLFVPSWKNPQDPPSFTAVNLSVTLCFGRPGWPIAVWQSEKVLRPRGDFWCPSWRGDENKLPWEAGLNLGPVTRL